MELHLEIAESGPRGSDTGLNQLLAFLTGISLQCHNQSFEGWISKRQGAERPRQVGEAKVKAMASYRLTSQSSVISNKIVKRILY